MWQGVGVLWSSNVCDYICKGWRVPGYLYACLFVCTSLITAHFLSNRMVVLPAPTHIVMAQFGTQHMIMKIKECLKYFAYFCQCLKPYDSV